MADEAMTEQEAENLIRSLTESKENNFSFFTKVIQHSDSTKIGNLNIDELGLSNHPVRTYKELAHFCNNVCNDKSWGNYFDGLAEINLATSLSKEGFLIRQAGTSRKEIADVSPMRRENKGHFQKKEKEANQS